MSKADRRSVIPCKDEVCRVGAPRQKNYWTLEEDLPCRDRTAHVRTEFGYFKLKRGVAVVENLVPIRHDQ